MGFLDPIDAEPKDPRAYRQAIETTVPIEIETLSYHGCHFVRARIAGRKGLPSHIYERLRRSKDNSVLINLAENLCPNAAAARECLLLSEKSLLSLLREHRKPHHRQMPWLITKAGAHYLKHHWSPKVRKRAHTHAACPGSKESMRRPWYQVFAKRVKRCLYLLRRKLLRYIPAH